MKRNSILCLLLGVVILLFTSSKKENKESFYSEGLNALSSETLLDGSRISVDSLRGRMLLLSFWASYDPSSRINSYSLLSLQKQYSGVSFEGGEGLNVVCVSFDTFKSPLRKAIDADGTKNFFHICDYKGVESPLAEQFDVCSPVNLLVGADGRILARDFGTTTIAETLAFLAH